MTIQPFGLIEVAAKQAVESVHPDSVGKVGGDLSYDGTEDHYVYIAMFTGTSNKNEGEWFLDIDVFALNYAEAMRIALAIEAALVDGVHHTDEMIIDRVVCTTTPTDRPWEDESIFRIGGTFSFAARRKG